MAAAEMENSPPAISAGTPPEAAKALREWHKRYMKQVAPPTKNAPKPMFTNVEELLAWVKDGGEIIGREKGKPAKLDKDGELKKQEVPAKITWTKRLPEGNVFTFVEFKFAADIEREKAEAEAAKSRVVHTPRKGKEAAFKWVSFAVSTDETRPSLCLIAIAPNGDCFATDGHRAHRANGVFQPAEGWRGIDKKGVEVPFDKEEYANIDAYIRGNGPWAGNIGSTPSLFACEVAYPDAKRVECLFSEGILKKIAGMEKIARKEAGIHGVSVFVDNGLLINQPIYDFDWGGIALPATAGVTETGALNVKYLLDACAEFATVKWPVAYLEHGEDPKHAWGSIGPAHIKNVHGEALVMPVRR